VARDAERFRATGLLSSLPYKPAGGRSKRRLEFAVGQSVLQAIEEAFLNTAAAGQPLPRNAFCGVFSIPHRFYPKKVRQTRTTTPGFLAVPNVSMILDGTSMPVGKVAVPVSFVLKATIMVLLSA
jgi:hypothetical protein